MRWLLAIPLLAALAAETSPPEAAPPLERWRFNARERTARGLAAWQQEKPAEAVGALDSALRLRPDDPLASFNAGTARLAAGAPEAEPLLERAAAQAGEELAPDAYYNLGNARLAGGNPRGAIDAYQHALRRRADFPAAKRNLELALRRLEQQQKEQQQREQQQQPQNRPQDRPDGNPQQSPPSSGAPDDPADSSSPQPPEESRGAPPAPEEQGPQGSGSPDESQTPSGAERPLPQFRDQQDMTAEQAAAILQAVENLERQQRREQHEQRARSKARVEKDW